MYPIRRCAGLRPFDTLTMTFMQRPIVKATVQAAGLSALSNVLAQMIAAYRTGVSKLGAYLT